MRSFPTIALVMTFALSAGCATEETTRMDGLTLGAGNAMAANTVMQMVDPWPRGVENTNLIVPADPGRYKSAEASAVAAKPGGSSVGGDN